VCRQMISQQLADRLGKATVTGITPENFFRLAAEERIITNLGHWLEYLDCEHLTPSSNLALRTFEKASAFLEDAAELLNTCTQRNQHERRRAA